MEEPNFVSPYQHIFDVIVKLVIEDKDNIFGFENLR
jgi:hypothetical protein